MISCLKIKDFPFGAYPIFEKLDLHESKQEVQIAISAVKLAKKPNKCIHSF